MRNKWLALITASILIIIAATTMAWLHPRLPTSKEPTLAFPVEMSPTNLDQNHPAPVSGNLSESEASPSPSRPDITSTVYLPIVSKPEESGWLMAGANVERTSWTPEEVRGDLRPVWYKPIEPYIPPRVQIVAAYGTLYISTARGLYALDANTGAEKWVYATELPLGHSPTIHNGIAYVGGFDRKLHAINALTGKGLWTFEAGAGFDTNPLVVAGLVYAGNRDGVFYAVRAEGADSGKLAWSYPTQGPIHYSAAYKDGVVFFASDDAHAYALNAQTGKLVWKSPQLPGVGFRSWWPVIYQNVVILSGSSGYRIYTPPFSTGGQQELEYECVFPSNPSAGTLIGTRGADGWINATRANNCSEQYPWRRTYLVLDRATGQEVSYDFDQDGRPNYAPILWFGTRSGNRYPPVVGSDGIIYQANSYVKGTYDFRGQVSGWRIGTPYISTPSANTLANDEPVAYAAGGNVIYWNLCCDRTAGAFDLSKPNGPNEEWIYFSYDLAGMIPGYNVMYNSDDIDAAYGGANGVYGEHGDQNPPIPYQGKVYMHRSNAVIAFGNASGRAVKLPLATTRTVSKSVVTADVAQLKQKLETEVLKILDAGHLRPGYGVSGNFDQDGISVCGDSLMDYWHDPSETLYTLLRALPYLTSSTQQRAQTYLQSEFANYFQSNQFSNIGWRDGAAREAFALLPEVNAERAALPPSSYANYEFVGWGQGHDGTGFPPHIFYALWKYAEKFGGAKTIFDNSRDLLTPEPGDAVLAKTPFVHNSFIAGYIGYLELQKLAGYTESATIRNKLNRLLALRASSFSKDSPYGKLGCNPDNITAECYCKTMSASRNFMNLVPELGQYLHDNARAKVQAAVDEYHWVTPYWFAQGFEATYGEGAAQPVYDYVAIFQAKALILQEPRGELVKYLDAPSVAVGDLYYIQNLVAAIEAPAN